MSGLIWSALGQAVSNAGNAAAGMMTKGIEEERQMSFRERLMQLEEEKQRRLASFAQDLEVAGIGRRTEATANAELAAAPTRGKAAVAQRQATVEGLENSGIIKREAELAAQGKEAAFDAEKSLREKQQKEEQDGIIAKANNKPFLQATRILAEASMSPLQRAAVTEQNIKNDIARTVADTRKQLSQLGADDPQREVLQRTIQDLTGASTKSFGDMVSAGDSYRKMADNLRREVDRLRQSADPSAEDEIKSLVTRAEFYESQADRALGSAIGRRMPEAAVPRPAPGKAPAAQPGQPWTRFSAPQTGPGYSAP